MGRADVKYNDKWSCFSSIVDYLIIPFVSLDVYEQWRKEEYGRMYSPILERNVITIEEAVSRTYMVHGRDKTIASLVDCGLSLEEADNFVTDEEIKNYQPVQDGDKYFCPNCGTEVTIDMERCSEYTCELKLVWG